MFVYNSVQEKPSNVLWFKDVNPSAYATILQTVRSAPGYVDGSWDVDPNNPNKFLITHRWADKASWETMSDSLKSLAEMQMVNSYRKTNNIKFVSTLSE